MQYNKNNPLRVITLCSGYDSQCLALERLHQDFPDFYYELVAWSEIDEHAIRAHNVLFPQWAERYGAMVQQAHDLLHDGLHGLLAPKGLHLQRVF